MKNIKKTTQVNADQALIAGLQKHFGSSAGLLVAGQNHPIADLVATLTGRVGAISAATAAETSWKALLAKAHAELDATTQLVAALRQAILAAFDGQPDVLADF